MHLGRLGRTGRYRVLHLAQHWIRGREREREALFHSGGRAGVEDPLAATSRRSRPSRPSSHGSRSAARLTLTSPSSATRRARRPERPGAVMAGDLLGRCTGSQWRKGPTELQGGGEEHLRLEASCRPRAAPERDLRRAPGGRARSCSARPTRPSSATRRHGQLHLRPDEHAVRPGKGGRLLGQERRRRRGRMCAIAQGTDAGLYPHRLLLRRLRFQGLLRAGRLHPPGPPPLAHAVLPQRALSRTVEGRSHARRDGRSPPARPA